MKYHKVSVEPVITGFVVTEDRHGMPQRMWAVETVSDVMALVEKLLTTSPEAEEGGK